MNYERTTLRLHGGLVESVQALRVGEWYVHRKPFGEGLTISHRSGVRLVDGPSPVQAVRLLRRLRLTAAPLNDYKLHMHLGGAAPDYAERMSIWRQQLRRVLADAGCDRLR